MIVFEATPSPEPLGEEDNIDGLPTYAARLSRLGGGQASGSLT
jgi:hypothetical protein